VISCSASLCHNVKGWSELDVCRETAGVPVALTVGIVTFGRSGG
jgi:hypothetical protein